MIYLTKKNKERTRFLLNHRLIETIEAKSDTFVILDNGKRYIVDENAEEIKQLIIDFESKILKYQTFKEDETE